MRRLLCKTEGYYSICNRGALNSKIFDTTADYMRFLLCLKEFNTNENIDLRQVINYPKMQSQNIGAQPLPLEEIAAYCLLPEHYHIIVRQVAERGIPLFMKKLGTGFAMHVNSSRKTVGHIFQGSFIAREVQDIRELLFLSAYIHLEPIQKKSERVPDMKMNEAKLKKISEYPWSSIKEYLGLGAAFVDLTEIKNVKPRVNSLWIKNALGSQSYENYILNFWGKESNYPIDKRFL